MGPGQLDVTSSQGKALLGMMAVFAGMEADRISESTRAGLAWCRANGLFCGGTPPFGRKPISTGRKGRKYLVWDEGECRQIREIWHRYQSGETIHAIAIEFHQRGEKTATGRLWVPPSGSRRGRRLPNTSRVYRVIAWYRERLARGLELGMDVIEDIPGDVSWRTA